MPVSPRARLGLLFLGVGCFVSFSLAADSNPDLAALAKKLQSKSATDRAAAVAEVAKLGPDAKSLTPLLCEAAADPSPKLSRAALDALGQVQPELGKLVTTLLVDKDPQQQISAAEKLKEASGDGGATPVVAAHLKRLATNNQLPLETRFKLVSADFDALIEWAEDSPEALKALIGFAGSANRDGLVKQSAIGGLAFVARSNEGARKEIAPVLVAALNDPASRMMAIEAVGQLGEEGKAAVPALKKLKLDPLKSVAKAAGEALDRIEASKPKPTPPEFDPKAKEKAVKAAIDWIVKNQLEDGSWDSGMGDNRPALVATTSFCGLALLASGGAHDEQLKKATEYVTANLFEDLSKIKAPENWDQSNWKIALGGLFLAEYYAALKKKDAKFRSTELEQTLEKIVEEACKRMETSGGWGHTPRLKNPLGYVELEVVSNWMMMTLGICQRLEIKVPGDKIKLATQFIVDSCKSGRGAVGYSPREGQKGFGAPGRTGGALCAFGLLNLQSTDLYPRMAASWKKEVDRSGEGHGSVALGLLGSGLGARQLGAADWKSFQASFAPPILAAANTDGSFQFLTGKTIESTGFDNKMSKAYNTGIYALLLQLDSGNLQYLGKL